jgi:hypothetical protein
MQYCAKVQPNDLLLVNTQIPTRSEVIGARLAETNSLHLKPNFTQDVAGLLSTRQLPMML